ncbi:MAG: hypothetical protein ACKVOU_15010 [Cytophagales bacterium]
MQIRLGIVLVWFFASHFIFAQGVSQSPFAQFGYGDLEYLANARLQGMGGSGSSLINSSQINLKNPATAAYNRQNVIFEGGFYGQNANFSTSTDKQTILSGNINYLALLVPISAKNWTVIAGINPFSNANTKFATLAKVTSADSSYISNSVTIDGGLNQVFLTNAIKLPAGFSIGLTTSLVFGTINRRNEGLGEYINNGARETPATKTVVRSQEIYRFIDFKLGLGYNKLINANYAIGIAATGTFNQNISAERVLINSINSNNLSAGLSGFVIYSDTISTEQISAKLPSVYTFGVNFDRVNRWSFALDYTFTDYSQYKSFDPINVYTSGGHRIALGSEFTPDYQAIRGYFKRAVYRAGIYYASLPFTLKNTEINDFGGSLGLGLPVGKGGIGMLNLAVAVGRRGTTQNGLIEENYLKFFVGVNINDRWFIRYKID